jgi:hypothetical protein
MKSIDLKIILIGTIISLIVNPFIMLIHTSLEFFSAIKLNVPLAEYFLYGYSPLVIAGIYIANTKSKKVILISIWISLLYGLLGILFDYFFSGFNYFFSKHFESTTALILIRYINVFILYIILTAGSCAITSFILKKDIQMSNKGIETDAE